MVIYCSCWGVRRCSCHKALWFKTQRTTAHLRPGGRPGGVLAYKLLPCPLALEAEARSCAILRAFPSDCNLVCCTNGTCCGMGGSDGADPAPFWAVLEALTSGVAGVRKCRPCEGRAHVAAPVVCIAVAACQRGAGRACMAIGFRPCCISAEACEGIRRLCGYCRPDWRDLLLGTGAWLMGADFASGCLGVPSLLSCRHEQHVAQMMCKQSIVTRHP